MWLVTTIHDWLKNTTVSKQIQRLDAVSPSVTNSTQIGKVVPLPPIKILEEQVKKLKEKAAMKRQRPVVRRSGSQPRLRLDKG